MRRGRRQYKTSKLSNVFSKDDEEPPCGSLKLEGQMNSIRIHGHIPGGSIEGAGDWYRDNFQLIGWARVDGNQDGTKTFTDQWPTERNKVVTIKNVEHFTEYDRTTKQEIKFHTKEHQIAAIVNNSGEIRILTREARTEQEKKVHHRMPVTIHNNRGRDGLIKYINKKLGSNYD